MIWQTQIFFSNCCFCVISSLYSFPNIGNFSEIFMWLKILQENLFQFVKTKSLANVHLSMTMMLYTREKKCWSGLRTNVIVLQWSSQGWFIHWDSVVLVENGYDQNHSWTVCTTGTNLTENTLMQLLLQKGDLQNPNLQKGELIPKKSIRLKFVYFTCLPAQIIHSTVRSMPPKLYIAVPPSWIILGYPSCANENAHACYALACCREATVCLIVRNQ